MKETVVFDIDGTLSIVGDRIKCLENKDWDTFYARCGEDKVNEPIAKILRAFIKTQATIIYLTGRKESCRQDTITWLVKNNLMARNGLLFMRPNGDYRHDTIVKFEQLGSLIKYVDLVFEDRGSMVKAWRNKGITCCQVAPGNF